MSLLCSETVILHFIKTAVCVSPCTNHSSTVPDQTLKFWFVLFCLVTQWSNRRHQLPAGSTEVMELSNLPPGLRWPRARASREADFSLGDLYLLASPPFFPHCLLFPDSDGADCVSLTASAPPIPQGAPLTKGRLSAPTGSLWQLARGKSRRRDAEGRRAPWRGEKRSIEGCWLRTGRCPALINMVMSSAMTSHRKATGQLHRKWNLIETH